MNDGRLEFKELVAILVRRKKIIMQTTAVMFIIAILFNLLIPDRYESNVNLRVKYNRSLNDGLGLLSQQEIMQQQIYTYAEVIKGKTVVEGMMAKVFSQQDGRAIPSYEKMRDRINASPLKNTEILNIAVQGSSPKEAQFLAQALVETFLDKVSDMVRSEGKETKAFIGQRMEQSKANLERIEQDLASYKGQHNIYSVNDQTQSLIVQQNELKRLQANILLALDEGQNKEAVSAQQISQEKQGFIGDSLTVQHYKNRLAELETALFDLRKSYTENHPKVQGMRAAIAAAQEKLDQEIAGIARGDSPSSNPVHQNLLQNKLQGEVSRQVAESQLRTINRAISDSEQQLAGLPTKEQGLAKLLRDQAVAEAVYTELAKHYEQARIDEVKEPTNIQIVDLPDLPDKPSSPKIFLNIALAIFSGIFVGVILAFTAEIFFKTIDSAEDVQEYLGVAIIGEVLEISHAKSKSGFWNTIKNLWRK